MSTYRSTSSTSRYRVNGYRSQPSSHRSSVYSVADYGTSSALNNDMSDFDRHFKRLLERTEKFTNRVEKLQNTASSLRKGFRDIDRTVSGRGSHDQNLSTFDFLIEQDQETTEEQWRRCLELGILIEKAVEMLRQQYRYPKPVFEYSPESRSPYSYNITPDTKLVSNPHSPLDKEGKKIIDRGSEIIIPENNNPTEINDCVNTTKEKPRFRRFGRYKDKIATLTEQEEPLEHFRKPESKILTTTTNKESHQLKQQQQHQKETVVAKEKTSFHSKLFSSSSFKKHKEKEEKVSSPKPQTFEDPPATKTPPTTVSDVSTLSNQRNSSHISPLPIMDENITDGNKESNETTRRRLKTAKERSAASKARPSTLYNDNSSNLTNQSLETLVNDALQNKTPSIEVIATDKPMGSERSSKKSSKRNSFLDDSSLSRGNSSSRSSYHEYIPGHRMPLKERLKLRQQQQSSEPNYKPASSLGIRASKLIRAKYHGNHNVDHDLDNDKNERTVTKSPSFKSRFLRKFRGGDKDGDKEKDTKSSREKLDDDNGGIDENIVVDNSRIQSNRDSLDLQSSKEGFVNPSFHDLQNSDSDGNSNIGSTDISNRLSEFKNKCDILDADDATGSLRSNFKDGFFEDDYRVNFEKSPVIQRNSIPNRRKRTARQNTSANNFEVGNLNRKSVHIYEEQIVPSKTRKEKIVLHFRSPQRSREEVAEEGITIVTKDTSSIISDDLFEAFKESEVKEDEVQCNVISTKTDIDESIFDRIHQIPSDDDGREDDELDSTSMRAVSPTKQRTPTYIQSSRSSSEDGRDDTTRAPVSQELSDVYSASSNPLSSLEIIGKVESTQQQQVERKSLLVKSEANNISTISYSPNKDTDDSIDTHQESTYKEAPSNSTMDAMDVNNRTPIVQEIQSHFNDTAMEIANYSNNITIAKKTKDFLRNKFIRSKSFNESFQNGKRNLHLKLAPSKSVDLPSKSPGAPKSQVKELSPLARTFSTGTEISKRIASLPDLDKPSIGSTSSLNKNRNINSIDSLNVSPKAENSSIENEDARMEGNTTFSKQNRDSENEFNFETSYKESATLMSQLSNIEPRESNDGAAVNLDGAPTNQSALLLKGESSESLHSESSTKKRLSYLERRQQHMVLLDKTSDELRTSLDSLLDTEDGGFNNSCNKCIQFKTAETTEPVRREDRTPSDESPYVSFGGQFESPQTSDEDQITSGFVNETESAISLPALDQEPSKYQAVSVDEDAGNVGEIKPARKKSSITVFVKSYSQDVTLDSTDKNNHGSSTSSENASDDVFPHLNETVSRKQKDEIGPHCPTLSDNQSSSSRSVNGSDDDNPRKERKFIIFEKQMSIKEYRMKKRAQSLRSAGSLSDEEVVLKHHSDIEQNLASVSSTSEASNQNVEDGRHKRYSHNRKDVKTDDFFSSSSENEFTNFNSTNNASQNNSRERTKGISNSYKNYDDVDNNIKTARAVRMMSESRLQYDSDNTDIATERRKKYSRRAVVKSVENF